jgi:integrase
VFPGERGGYLDIHHFRPFQWRPAQRTAGVTPFRRVYDLRHTFATFAVRAGMRRCAAAYALFAGELLQ